MSSPWRASGYGTSFLDRATRSGRSRGRTWMWSRTSPTSMHAPAASSGVTHRRSPSVPAITCPFPHSPITPMAPYGWARWPVCTTWIRRRVYGKCTSMMRTTRNRYRTTWSSPRALIRAIRNMCFGWAPTVEVLRVSMCVRSSSRPTPPRTACRTMSSTASFLTYAITSGSEPIKALSNSIRAPVR